MDYLLVKKPTITMKQHFFDQLCLFESILQSKYGFTLTKTWNDQFSNPEDQLISNTYLNTLSKGRKSPRGSVTERLADKRQSITWNKKIKDVLPVALLNTVNVQASGAGSKDVGTVKSAINQSRLGKQTELEGQEMIGFQSDTMSEMTAKKTIKFEQKNRTYSQLDETGTEASSQIRGASVSAQGFYTSGTRIKDEKSQKQSFAEDLSQAETTNIRRNGSFTQEQSNKEFEVSQNISKTQKVKTGQFKLRSNLPDSANGDRQLPGQKAARGEIGNILLHRSNKAAPECQLWNKF